MKIKKEPSQVWNEYKQGIDYKTAIGLYDTVERNNNFFNDKQWEGVRAPDLDKPVFNILKPVVNYYTAMLISDDIAVNVEVMNGVDTLERADFKVYTPGAQQGPQAIVEDGAQLSFDTKSFGMDEIVPKVISREVDAVLESANVRFKNRRMIRNCAVDGDACFYMWFDPDAETGFDYTGAIKVDVVDNTNVYFGNPSDSEVQEQPYMIIAYRRLTDEVREEAKANGLNADAIYPDDEKLNVNEDKDTENCYTTVLLKMWKERGTVRIMKCTEKAVVKREVDTGYKLYPVSWMSWEAVKNSYHGVSPLTGKINNQIFINKIYALSMRFVASHAFPKVVYDRTKLPQGWSNDVNKAIGVAGDPNTAILAGYRPPDMSADAMNMAKETMQSTKDLMGASDAALGNVKPDNTSAIVAVQKAAGMPLDIQRMDFHNFVESYVRIFIEMMRVNYGVRFVSFEENDQKMQGEFDFSVLGKYAMNLNIDIGAGSYWSELMQIQTLDNLMDRKVIPDALTYLEAIPEGYIKNKNKIMDRIRQAQGGMLPLAGVITDGSAEGGMPAEEMGSGMPPQLAGMGGAVMPMEVAIPDVGTGIATDGAAPAPEEFAPMESGMMNMGAQTQTAMPPIPNGTEQTGGLTPQQFDGVLQDLLAMEPEMAIATLKEMDISEEAKRALFMALDKIWSERAE